MVAALEVQKLQEDQNQGSWLALGTLLGLILKAHRGLEAFQRALEEVLDAHCLKNRFLKDVFNEITTFGGSLEPQNHSETAHNPCWEP